MPYLKYDDKERLLDHMFPETAGELNFLVTTMARRYWSKSKRNYEALNAITGALENAKLEFYRKVTSKYEDQKAEENGEIYIGDLK